MSIKTIVSSITGLVFSKKNPHRKLKALFHEQALPHGHHGTLIVNSRSRGFKNERVRFVFSDTTKAPSLTPLLLEHLWQEAIKNGYEPMSVCQYGTSSFFKDGTAPVTKPPREIHSTQIIPPVEAPIGNTGFKPALVSPAVSVRAEAAQRFDQLQSRYDTANQAMPEAAVA